MHHTIYQTIYGPKFTITVKICVVKLTSKNYKMSLCSAGEDWALNGDYAGHVNYRLLIWLSGTI
jgi:hypothetical protein